MTGRAARGVEGPKPRRRPRPGHQRRALPFADVAVDLLAAVLDRRQPLDALFDPSTGDRAWRALPERDRRLARAIVTAALRHHGEIEAALARLIERPPRRAGQLFRILEVAAAQLLFLDVPDHAAVSVAMDQVAADRDALHFKGLANAVLRRLAREREAILAGARHAARRHVPDWLWRRWVGAYGEDAARRIAAANLEEPAPRPHRQGRSRALGRTARRHRAPDRLGAAGRRRADRGPARLRRGRVVGAGCGRGAPAAAPRRHRRQARRRPLRRARRQDRGAGRRPAPRSPPSTSRSSGSKRVTANLARLGLVGRDRRRRCPRPGRRPSRSTRSSSTRPAPRPAPSAATPTSPGSSGPRTSASLADLQGRMIDRAVGWLKPGGMLVYRTCSLEPEEGEEQMARALHRHDLEILPVDAGRDRRHCRGRAARPARCGRCPSSSPAHAASFRALTASSSCASASARMRVFSLRRVMARLIVPAPVDSTAGARDVGRLRGSWRSDRYPVRGGSFALP